MKNFTITIENCKKENLVVVLGILKEAIMDDQADIRFWDMVSDNTRIKAINPVLAGTARLIFTETNSSNDEKNIVDENITLENLQASITGIELTLIRNDALKKKLIATLDGYLQVVVNNISIWRGRDSKTAHHIYNTAS